MLDTSLNKFAFVTAVLITMLGITAASPAQLGIFPKEADTRINSFTEYEVEVTNVGPVEDRYKMSSKSQEVTIAPRDFYLESGESKTVNVWYNPGEDKEAGRYSFAINAESTATGKTYSVEGIVNVIREHDVSMEIGEAKTSCLNEETTYTVDITNEGLQKEEFKLSTDYGALSDRKVSIEDGETRQVLLKMKSSEPVEKTFNVRAASTTSYAQDVKTVEFNAERCFASDVTFSTEQKEVPANTPAEVDVTVRNTGTKADTFVLSSSEGDLSDTEIDIPAKSTETVTLQYTPNELGKKEVTVTAKSTVTSESTVTFEVYNGNDVEVSFPQNNRQVCETDQFEMEAEIENTGEAPDTYSLSSTEGSMNVEKLALQPGESKKVLVGFNASEYNVGEEKSFEFTAASQAFDEPEKTATGNFEVQNCYDLDMNIVPKIASAGENRSLIYEIKLDNTGEKENTYRLSYEGPEWISVKPDEVTVPAGEQEIAYMYAGVPFQKKGEVKITATATGTEIQKSEEVTLVIGDEVEEAIRSDRDGFLSPITGAVTGVTESQNFMKVLFSVVLGILITVFVLFRE